MRPESLLVSATVVMAGDYPYIAKGTGSHPGL
jgi:hypothetical protein